MSTPHQTFAFDRSVRRYDADGHLHVGMTNISKANVCPYFGREIPNYQALGLDANKVYRLYRHPDELRKAASTFAGKPLLMHHQPVASDEHPDELVVGSIGTDVAFDGVYLKAPISIWKADAIKAVETEEQRELSPGYRYRADMTRGVTPEGVAYDGVMRDIMGNHLALVTEGRTGPDVLVADHKPAGFSTMRFQKFFAALASAFPSLTADQTVALDSALAEDVLKKVDVVHCVEDEFPDLSDEERKAALDACMKSSGKAMDALTDEDKRAAYKQAKDAKGQPTAAVGGKQPQAADEAAVNQRIADAVAAATKDTVAKTDADKLALDAAIAARAEVHALYAARKAVEATVGEVALDSAEAVYRFALDHLKVDHKDTAASGLPALYEASAKAAAAPAAQIAQDGAAGFDPSILGLTHIRKG
jgi:hypothetical protein